MSQQADAMPDTNASPAQALSNILGVWTLPSET